MNKKPLEIITAQKEAHSSIGTRRGEHGLATQSSSTEPATKEEWRNHRFLMKSQIKRLTSLESNKRNARIILILEEASAKIDRFGWNSMEEHIKAGLREQWVEALKFNTLNEINAGVRAAFVKSGGKLRSINEFMVLDEIKNIHAMEVKYLPEQADVEAISPRNGENKDEFHSRRSTEAQDIMKIFTNGRKAK